MAVSIALLSCAIVAYTLWWYIKQLQDPSRAVPGPAIARFTRLWYLYRIWLGNWNSDIVQLHRKYGKIFRYAPGQYSFSDPAAIKSMHGYGAGFEKTPAYDAWNAPGTVTLFSSVSNKTHGQLRKKYQHMYSMSNALTYEESVDSCVALFSSKLEEREGQQIDITSWIHCFVSDAMALLTFGKRFGSLDKGEDIGGFSVFVRGVARYATFMGVMVEWHWLYWSVASLLSKLTSSTGTARLYLNQFAMASIGRRREERASGSAKQVDVPNTMLDQFLDANEKDPAEFETRHIMIGLGGNIVAGSDTTSTAVTAILFYLLKTPEAMKQVRSEILAKVKANGSASSLEMTDLQALPYLNAVVTECMRLFPQTGLGLPRQVPDSGAEISGHAFTAGSVVSMSSWAAHYDEDNFGADAAVFRPERWLEIDQEQKDRMNKAWFPFGLGSRTCLGRNIATLIMLKGLASMLTRFDFELQGSERTLEHPKAIADWVIRTDKMLVTVRCI
ncbi:Putative cytochrome P450 [Septoria linicola]|uniref:Cytochrome P450 n=1 Tax=Septoria linicola TaxID=215465 RepID=A0A9Q9EHH1_9PEZI|nr:putative cytochrome P450 [Septoria linicola]USW49922.1 Putative cytochrome P450 [Septoria linicola]